MPDNRVLAMYSRGGNLSTFVFVFIFAFVYDLYDRVLAMYRRAAINTFKM